MKLRDSFFPIFIILATLIAAIPIIISGGIINAPNGDTPLVFFKLQQIYSALTQFVFPVRWMSDATLGLGSPFLNYNFSLAFYIAALFKIFGASYSLSIKLTQLLALVLSSFTMFNFARAIRLNQFAAALAALAYLFAPFHLASIFSRADSLGELFAFALSPLVLYSVQLTAVTPSPRSFIFFSATFTALILSHPTSAFIFFPIIIAFYFISHSSFNIRHLALFVAHCLLSFALTSFAWFPAWRELSYVRLDNPQATGFLGFDLVQPSFFFNYDANSNAMSWIQILLVAFGVFAIFVRQSNTKDDSTSPLITIFIVIGFLASTIMLTSVSQSFWVLLPFLNYIQFAWQFFLPQTLFASLIIGFILQSSNVAQSSFQQLINDTRLRIILIAVVAYCLINLVGVRPDYITITDADVTPQRLQLYEYVSGKIGITRNTDYLPKWVDAQPTTSEEFTRATTQVALKTLSGNASGERTGKGAASQSWRVLVSSESAIVALPVIYFPSWSATVDGNPLDLRRADGFGWIAFAIPQGEHKVEIKFGNTFASSASSIVSIIALLIAIGLAIFSLRDLPDVITIANVVVSGGAILVVLVFFVVVERFINLQIKLNSAATMDVVQQPFLHSDEVNFQNGDVLRSYMLSSETPAPGDVLTVSLLWQSKGRGDFVLELVAPSSSAITRVNGKAANVPVSVNLPIPNDLSGVYLLRLLYSENGESIPALTSNSKVRDQLLLKPLHISGGAAIVSKPPTPGQRITELPPMQFRSGATFGTINLAGYDVSIKNRVLSLSLYWQASAPSPKSYKAYVHIYDPVSGKIVLQSDTYPAVLTSNWIKNEVVLQADTFSLEKLPRGLYNVGVGWYDETTGQRIGERVNLNHAVVVP